ARPADLAATAVISVVGLSGWPVRGHRDGHRRDGCAVHNGVQRRRYATSVASPPGAVRRRKRPVAPAAADPARLDRGDRAAGLCLLSLCRRSLRAGVDRTDLVCRGGAICAGDARRPVLEAGHTLRGHGRSAGWICCVGLYPAVAFLRPLGLVAAGVRRAWTVGLGAVAATGDVR